MQAAIDQFRENIKRVRALGGLYGALTKLATSVLDSSDILRAQIVMVVSALDHYVHEVTRIGMVDVYEGSRLPTSSFNKFQIPIESVVANSGSIDNTSWFECEVREKHNYLSFQQPEKISGAIRLFSPIQLWPTVASSLNMEPIEVITRLKLIIDRRNKIAHEADLDPSYPGARWPISENDVEETVDFIERIAEAIHESIILIE